MLKDFLFLIKEKQLGYVKSIKGQWEGLPFPSIKVQY